MSRSLAKGAVLLVEHDVLHLDVLVDCALSGVCGGWDLLIEGERRLSRWDPEWQQTCGVHITRINGCLANRTQIHMAPVLSCQVPSISLPTL